MAVFATGLWTALRLLRCRECRIPFALWQAVFHLAAGELVCGSCVRGSGPVAAAVSAAPVPVRVDPARLRRHDELRARVIANVRAGAPAISGSAAC